jgi:choice-of-anchor B domain-containing protein
MKKALLAFLLLPLLSSAQNYDSQNVTMLGQWNNPSQPAEPTYGIKYQTVWGWYQQSTNREYAIIGTSTGTEFVDVTNPTNPVPCDYIPAVHGNLIWHEIKTYQNYCYIVSDDNAPNSFIIADMSYLPDSVHVVRNDNTLFERCHTIYVDGDKLYGGSVTKSNNTFYSMAVYDLSADPANPTLLRTLNQDYPAINHVHDMYVINDTVYASCGYDALHIYKFNSSTTNTFTELASLTNYPEQGYNHSSFLTADRHTLIFMDEVPAGKGIKSLDVSNFGNLSINQVFRSNTGNTPHNPYIIGNTILIAANYTDGVQIFDISNPSNIVRTGYFDSDTLINYPNYTQAYHGVWAAYPDLPSGHLLIGDMQNGLYVLDITQATMLGVHNPSVPNVALNAFPNPFSDGFFINLSLDHAQDIRYEVYDNTGRLVLEEQQSMPAGNSLLEIAGESLAPGIYTVNVKGETVLGSSKLVKE